MHDNFIIPYIQKDQVSAVGQGAIKMPYTQHQVLALSLLIVSIVEIAFLRLFGSFLQTATVHPTDRPMDQQNNL